MFDTLECSWDQSSRRGRATVASFTIQSVSLGFSIAASILWVQRPPQVHWLQLPPHVAATTGDQQLASQRHPTTSSSHSAPVVAPRSVPREQLTINDGHPMLSGAAIEAVRQWRYRPYFLNNEPVEVETEITVNFVLSAS
jgi:Gram-negative bacterial TonB protein C-terminal